MSDSRLTAVCPEQVPNTESTCLSTVKTITWWSVPLGQTKHTLMVSCLCAFGVFCQLQLIDLWGGVFVYMWFMHAVYELCICVPEQICPSAYDFLQPVSMLCVCVYVDTAQKIYVCDCQSLILVWQPATLSDAWLAGSWVHPLLCYWATGGCWGWGWGWGLGGGLTRWFISLLWCKQAVAITINSFWK